MEQQPDNLKQKKTTKNFWRGTEINTCSCIIGIIKTFSSAALEIIVDVTSLHLVTAKRAKKTFLDWQEKVQKIKNKMSESLNIFDKVHFISTSQW